MGGTLQTAHAAHGEYLGGLYDIGFDKPEAHAISKDGALYYAFYADRWDGKIPLRGLGAGKYRVHDLFNDVDLGTVDATSNNLATRFERSARRKTMGNWELYGEFYRSLCETPPGTLPHIFVETFAQSYDQVARETDERTSHSIDAA